MNTTPPVPRCVVVVVGDRVQPSARAVGVQPRRVAHEDLQAALVGVLRVVGAQAVAAGRAQQRIGVRGDEVEDELLGLLG